MGVALPRETGEKRSEGGEKTIEGQGGAFCPIPPIILSRNRGLFFKKVYGWLVLSKSQEGCNLLIFKRRFGNHDVI